MTVMVISKDGTTEEFSCTEKKSLPKYFHMFLYDSELVIAQWGAGDGPDCGRTRQREMESRKDLPKVTQDLKLPNISHNLREEFCILRHPSLEDGLDSHPWVIPLGHEQQSCGWEGRLIWHNTQTEILRWEYHQGTWFDLD
ncbi:hypothetical protein AV530_004833 [Patagioenas fasciata monilis]|uniref:Uncharacterized protein n=1 Tax=Patagioenas fasciata monilis TaxID=372326 RepID=A0A1V4KEC4_PATFA|nr:hypothetical protein AV530_004833 [Patagioenas fasciata monilis]